MDGMDLRAIDVCAGSGIGSAAFEACGFARTVCYIEREPYCQQLLMARMRSGDLLPAPIWDDLKTFDGRPWRGCVDFIFGGIPCQPHSVAGKQLGAADERDLWPDLRRVIREVGPRLVLVENVPGIAAFKPGGWCEKPIRSWPLRLKHRLPKEWAIPYWRKPRQSALGRIVGDLCSDGYDCAWATISAADLGANHLRKRVWLVAYRADAADVRGATIERHEQDGDVPGDVADAECAEWRARTPARYGARSGDSTGRERTESADGTSARGSLLADAEGQSERAGLCAGGTGRERRGRLGDGGGAGDITGCDLGGVWWQLEPAVGRLANGVAARVDQLKCLGNGWVPHCCAYVAGRILAGLLAEKDKELNHAN